MFKNLNLNWKINIIIILFVIVLMSVGGYIMYNFTTNIILNQITDKINIMAEYEKEKIIWIRNNLEKRINGLTHNSVLKFYTILFYNNYVISEDEKNNQDTIGTFISKASYSSNTELQKLTQSTNYVEFAFITTPDGFVIADSRQKLIGNPTKYIGRKLEAKSYKVLGVGNFRVIEDRPLLIMNKPIYSDDVLIGYFVIGLSINLFRENLNNLLGDYGTITIINDDGIILNHKDLDRLGDKLDNEWFKVQTNQMNEAKKETVNGHYYILNKIADINVYFAVDIPLNKINIPAKRISNVLIYIVFVSVIIILLIITYVINSQLRPLFLLSHNINKVRKGNLDVKIDLDRTDVIGKLADNFNKMVTEIKELLNKVKDDQQEIRKYELKALQAQINPHFLYNTLDSFSWMARAKKYDEIIKITVALSNFFRLSLNKGQDITSIKKEIEHVKNYLTIQKLRYPNKFECKINFAEDLYRKECLKLILQPLVENSLLHGLEKVDSGGLIVINGKKSGNDLVIQVYDNGSGFDPEQMEDMINSNDIDYGYALKNVKNRIEIYYGLDYGLSFYCHDCGGACVEVRLPIKNYRGKKECIS